MTNPTPASSRTNTPLTDRLVSKIPTSSWSMPLSDLCDYAKSSEEKLAEAREILAWAERELERLGSDDNAQPGENTCCKAIRQFLSRSPESKQI